MINSITRGKASLPPRIIVYGTEGVGKSTFAANAPATVFVQTEDGLGEIDCERFPLAQSFGEVIANLRALRDEPHNYSTIAVDSLDWLERLVWEDLCNEYNVASIEKVDGGYGKGYTHALGRWKYFLGCLDDLRKKRQMATILIAHAKIERFEDPEANSYDRYVPRLNKHAAGYICEWADAVLFATRRFKTEKEDAGFNRTRTIAKAIGKDGGERILRCIGSPVCVAKNRYQLPEFLPLDWSALVNAMTQTKESVTNG